jgi:hypothetical protein
MLQYGVGQNLLNDGISNRTATNIIRAAVKSAPDALHMFGSPWIRLIGQLPNPLKLLRLSGNLDLVLADLGGGSRLPPSCTLRFLNPKQ